MTLLDERMFSARRANPPTDAVFVKKPVLLIQANFIRGGLLLTFSGHHQAMDGTGEGLIMDLFNKACRGQPFTEKELSAGNVFRRDLIPTLAESSDHSSALSDQKDNEPTRHYLRREKPAPPAISTQPQNTWINLKIEQASVAAIKGVAMEALSHGKNFVSTDDAITAFLWQSISRARLSRLDASTVTWLGRAVNVRPFLGIPENCTGAIQNATHHSHTIKQLLDQPLGVLALQLRDALAPETSTIAQETREMASFLHRTPDKSVAIYGANIDPSKGLTLSSWSKLNSYSLDFGLGFGKPEAVRIPRFEPLEGPVYLLPKTRDGAIEVALSLKNEDLGILKTDKEFTKYVDWIG